LCKKERKNVSKDAYIEYMSFMDEPYVKSKKELPALYKFLIKNRFSYKIISKKKLKNSVVFKIEVSEPDIFVIAFDITKKAPELDDPKVSKEKKEKILKKTIEELWPDNKNIPLVKNINTYKVVQENKKWKLFLNLKKEINLWKSQQIQQKAWKKKFDGNLEEALNLYKQALLLTPDDKRLQKAIKQCEKAIKKRKEELKEVKDPYIKSYLKILNAKVKKKNRDWILSFTIKNLGDQTIFGMKVRFVYLDKNKKVLKIEKIPVSFWDELSPNSSKTLEKRLFFIPSKWNGKNFKVDIIKIETE